MFSSSRKRLNIAILCASVGLAACSSDKSTAESPTAAEPSASTESTTETVAVTDSASSTSTESSAVPVTDSASSTSTESSTVAVSITDTDSTTSTESSTPTAPITDSTASTSAESSTDTESLPDTDSSETDTSTITDELSETAVTPVSNIRVPAEWELQSAVWMQYPDQWEASMRPAFARIISVIQEYQPVHMLVRSETEKSQAQALMGRLGVTDENLHWHVVAIDNAWMRDNGPIYVTDGEMTWIQDWRFDAWGGNFGSDVGYANDDQVPEYVAEQLNMEVEDFSGYVLEKGNVEVNGNGILVIGWDCQDDRNPGMSKEEHEELLKEKLGVHTIIWSYGHYPGEGTTGHIDGTARFINQDTLVVTVLNDSNTDDRLVADAQAAGLTVLRYDGDVNWLVGNGFVVAAADEDEYYNEELQELLESFFPNRDVHLIDIASISEAGGGIHCVTNDQPLM